MKLAILGIGSPFGEDCVGWIVIDKINEQLNQYKINNRSILIEKQDRPGLSLIEKIKNLDSVIIIDAVKSQQNYGKIHELSLKDLNSKNLFSTHGFGVASALALAKTLNLLPKKIKIYGIEIRETQANIIPNSTLQNACTTLAHIILKTLK